MGPQRLHHYVLGYGDLLAGGRGALWWCVVVTCYNQVVCSCTQDMVCKPPRAHDNGP